MGFFSKLNGTIASFFQLGGPGAPGIRSNSTAVEARNSANSGFAVFRVATPVGDNDAVTKQYVDTTFKPIIVTAQFDGGSSLPSNTSTEHFYVTTTTGGTSSIGDLIWDDGSNTGTTVIVTAPTGGAIVVTVSLTGGTITFAAGTLAYWSGSAWTVIQASTNGVTYMTQWLVNNANTSSATNLSANAVVYDAEIAVTTLYSAGGTVELGISGTPNLFTATTDTTAQTVGTYRVPQLAGGTSVGSSAVAGLATVGGSPAGGASTVTLWWSLPNN